MQLIFQALWTTGADPSDDQVLGALARSLDVDRFRLSEQDVKDALRLETEQALARGVFGVPTLIVDGQLFWGADATDFARAYLVDPKIVATDEMKRVTMLPMGVSRKLR